MSNVWSLFMGVDRVFRDIITHSTHNGQKRHMPWLKKCERGSMGALARSYISSSGLGLGFRFEKP